MKTSTGLRNLRSWPAVGAFANKRHPRKVSRLLQSQRRCVHQVPALKHQKSRSDGFYAFLSPQALKTAWTDYQGWLVDNLNRLTQDTEDSNATPKTLAIRSGRDPNRAALFNYASMAHNNDFFFNTIHPKPSSVPQHLSEAINNSFSSFESLRETMLATADTMFGPGFVWLVALKNDPLHSRRLALLNTYLAGSPYAGAHWRRQATDMNTSDNLARKEDTGSEYAYRNRGQIPTYGLQNAQVGGFLDRHVSNKNRPGLVGAADVEPLLCVNVWPHVYLEQFGVAGKRQYLEKWWDSIDWPLVGHHYGVDRRGIR